VYGTFAGALVAPIGVAAFWVGPQWSLRVAAVIFVVGMVVSLRLPPLADSDPAEAVPRPFRTVLRLRRGPDRPLSGRLVIATLIGSAAFRCLYGFLLLYFAFAVKAGELDTTFFGRDLGSQAAVALVGGGLAVGTFLATAVGSRLRIRRPIALQSSSLTITAGVAVLATIFYSLPMVALLALVTSTFSGISKLAVDASIQERVPERLRASAFAHSETILMIAWVVGGAVGIIPLAGRLGMALTALFAVAAAVRAAIVAARLHSERLHGRPDVTVEEIVPTSPAPAPPFSSPRDPTPTTSASSRPAAVQPAATPKPPAAGATEKATGATRKGAGATEKTTGPTRKGAGAPGKATKTRVGGWRRTKQRSAAETPAEPVPDPPLAEPPPPDPDVALAPPGYHIYRPSSAPKGNGSTGDQADS
jgi:hypothetical protein